MERTNLARRELYSDLARYQYESALIQASRVQIRHSNLLSAEQSRVLFDWLDYAAGMLNPEPTQQQHKPF